MIKKSQYIINRKEDGNISGVRLLATLDFNKEMAETYRDQRGNIEMRLDCVDDLGLKSYLQPAHNMRLMGGGNKHLADYIGPEDRRLFVSRPEGTNDLEIHLLSPTLASEEDLLNLKKLNGYILTGKIIPW